MRKPPRSSRRFVAAFGTHATAVAVPHSNQNTSYQVRSTTRREAGRSMCFIWPAQNLDKRQLIPLSLLDCKNKYMIITTTQTCKSACFPPLKSGASTYHRRFGHQPSSSRLSSTIKSQQSNIVKPGLSTLVKPVIKHDRKSAIDHRQAGSINPRQVGDQP